ncbi:MAG: hypothetical protein FH749_00840 [Firmicutes bacterium]|nr:hypothetical protein [Bacillota bacterium]
MFDVRTPKTYQLTSNAFRGAYLPFLPTAAGKVMFHSGRVRGLRNLFFSGQWLQPPSGVQAALISGKDTVMRLCQLLKQLFSTYVRPGSKSCGRYLASS